MQPSVSIIIPCYNAGKFIEETIHSVLQQSFTDWELLVINDGSTDNIEAIVKKIADPRIRLFSKPNTGVSDSRNVGLENASGEFIWFLDADDLMSVDFLEKRIHFLLANPTCLIVGGKVFFIDENSQATGLEMFSPTENKAANQILLFEKNISSVPSNFVMRRSIQSHYNIQFNKSLSSTADKLFLLQVAKISTFGEVTGGELFYRIHLSSMSGSYTPVLVQDNEKYFALLEQQHLVPAELKKDYLKKKYYILAGANWKIRNYKKAFIYLIRLFIISPLALLLLFVKKPK